MTITEARTGMSDERALVRKVTMRLVPFLFVLYVIAYIDRVNVGFAKLAMNDLPWFSEKVFGFGAGIFFIGYFLFEIPSNLLLERFGARRWIMRIMLTWGVIAMAMCLAHSATTFYALRFALGLAEAGFFPGVLLYLTFWFTAKERAQVVALFMTANAVSYILGGPISGLILEMPRIGNLAPWQQLFLIEGLPAVLLGFVVLAYLPDKPADAGWLSADEKQRIEDRLARERAESPTAGRAHPSLATAVSHPVVILLCAVFFFLVVGMYGISLWMPQLIETLGKRTKLEVGLLTAIPYLFSGTIMVANAMHSDRTGERRFHVFIPALFGALGLIGCAYFHTPVLAIASMALAASGMWATLGPFWALPPRVLQGQGPAAIACGFALINSVGNLGGFIGPYAVGWIKDQTHDFKASLFTLAASVVVGGVLTLLANEHRLRHRPR